MLNLRRGYNPLPLRHCYTASAPHRDARIPRKGHMPFRGILFYLDFTGLPRRNKACGGGDGGFFPDSGLTARAHGFPTTETKTSPPNRPHSRGGYVVQGYKYRNSWAHPRLRHCPNSKLRRMASDIHRHCSCPHTPSESFCGRIIGSDPRR